MDGFILGQVQVLFLPAGCFLIQMHNIKLFIKLSKNNWYFCSKASNFLHFLWLNQNSSWKFSPTCNENNMYVNENILLPFGNSLHAANGLVLKDLGKIMYTNRDTFVQCLIRLNKIFGTVGSVTLLNHPLVQIQVELRIEVYINGDNRQKNK